MIDETKLDEMVNDLIEDAGEVADYKRRGLATQAEEAERNLQASRLRLTDYIRLSLFDKIAQVGRQG
jgi:hypothetical protein